MGEQKREESRLLAFRQTNYPSERRETRTAVYVQQQRLAVTILTVVGKQKQRDIWSDVATKMDVVSSQIWGTKTSIKRPSWLASMWYPYEVGETRT